ncbi:Re/Si-specific NAD(P)(+) transhydrogenase subunit alpha [Fulvimarina sp. MAC8]|uniref:Re/Si-specific NAD(P)(+) transhydrogenase subunit alpha n=1 Tax=Fulvimarina sp. MAC8 TaxID=3162874 RepID=UPI0032EFC51A
MKVFIPREEDGETRVAASPDTIKKLKGLGAEIVVQSGAGEHSRITDKAFEDAGASIGDGDSGKDADVVLKVRRPSKSEASGYKDGAVVLALMDPYGNEDALKELAEAKIFAFSMELMPRITRAQVMDVLSSQANLAGYQAVIDASHEFDRAFPMMMTAAGTVPAAKVFVMGAGVAGLQAIATAKRLGARVSANDIRPATKEQVESLGAKFIAVEDEEFKKAEDSGGYATEMSKEYQKKQAELVEEHIAAQDVVITTALIPGKPAPKLVSKTMIEAMKPGSVLVDLAVERGGNVEGSKPGEIVDVGPAKVIGYKNVAGRIAASASLLYAKNLSSFLETMIDKEAEKPTLKIDFDDELVKSTLLTRDGKVVHERFGGPSGSEEKEKTGEAEAETGESEGDN